MSEEVTRELVVSHYEADLDWLRSDEISDFFDVVIYSKGKQRSFDRPVEILPNVGREPHTYLHYCVEWYDDLPDVTVFCQDMPWHEPYFRSYDYFIERLHETILSPLDEPTPIADFYGQETIRCDRWGQPSHDVFMDIRKYWKRFFDSPPPLEYEFGPGCTIAVRREHITRRSLPWLTALRESINQPCQGKPYFKPEEVWILERLLLYVFGDPETWKEKKIE
jgi:hypothetical protein